MGESQMQVLILGSGASKASHFKLPTMAGFFTPEPSRFKPLFNFLEWFYPGRDKAEYNLEEVLAFVDLSRIRLPVWGDVARASNHKYESVYSQIIDYVKFRLEIPSDKSCPDHERLFSRLNQSDSILTVNYDLICDQALKKVEPQENGRPNQNSRVGKLSGLLHEQNLWGGVQPPALMPRERQSGHFLKLHGSLDWIQCPVPGCRANVNIFCRGLSKLSEGQIEGEPCRFCGSMLRTMIIPPVASKRLEDRGRLAFLWNLALREIRKATELVVIGMSLAPTDFEVRWLIREGLDVRRRAKITKKVIVVNPNSEAVDQVFRCIPSGDIQKEHFSSLSEYVDSLWTNTDEHP